MKVEEEIPERVSIPEQKAGYVIGYGPYPWLGLRAIVGGIFMGLASVVPGVSGGTMLLAAGIYPFFMVGIYDLSAFEWRKRSVYTVATVIISALVSVAVLGPYMRWITTNERWASFSLFAGLAAGGLPVVIGMAKPFSGRGIAAAVAGFVFALGLFSLRVLMEVPIDERVGSLWYFLGGLLAGGAMVLPGISGAYLMALLGVFMPIMDALDTLRLGMEAGDFGGAVERTGAILGPAAMGVAVGILLLARVFHRLLSTARKATLGTSIGLLLGALVELWPFQRAVRPAIGDVHGGRVLDAAALDALPAWRYPSEFFTPTVQEVATALVLFVCGFAITALGARFGKRHESGFDLAARSQA